MHLSADRRTQAKPRLNSKRRLRVDGNPGWRRPGLWTAIGIGGGFALIAASLAMAG